MPTHGIRKVFLLNFNKWFTTLVKNQGNHVPNFKKTNKNIALV